MIRARSVGAALLAVLSSVVLVAAAAQPASAGVTIPKVPGTAAASFTPRVVDDANYAEAGVLDLRQAANGQMFAGGEFRRVLSADGATGYTRYGVFSFNATTGAVSTWAPVTNGAVWALETSPDGRYVYIGGTFTQFDGVSTRLVKYDTVNQRVDPTFRAPTLNSRVYDIQYVGNRLLIGGRFNGGLLSVDPVTGAADTAYFNGVRAAGQNGEYATQVYRMAINPAKTRMVIVGSFTSIGGQRRQQAAVINLGASTATLNPWYSQLWNQSCARDLAWYTRDVDWAPDGSYFAIDTTGGPQLFGTTKLCDSISRWNAQASSNARPAWVNYSGGDTFHSLVATDKGIFVSGHFRWLNNPSGYDYAGAGAVVRQGLAAVDPATGQPLAWNPTKSLEGGKGGYVLYFTGAGLWVGSYETTLARTTHEGLGLLSF